MLSGNVLITGGSGFLGRAIISRAEREDWPARFTIYSRDETKQWDLQHRFPAVRCLLGDVARDMPGLIAAMTGHDLVIHAGALKYIPEAEHNVWETIAVNVQGSLNVAAAAIAAGVPQVVGISTDKASAPLNTYGMTKAVMERLFAEANRRTTDGTIFSTVRYGNVVGSTGSVIPVFRQQIRENRKLRITDPGMTRFWISPDQAVDLILLAKDWGLQQPGSTVVGANPAMSILDLAAAVWGLETGQGEPVVEFTGIRPGEKLHEHLFNEQEAPRAVPLYGGDNIYEPELTGYALSPATEKPVNHPDVPANGYVSNEPVRWLQPDEMALMIEQAGALG